MAAKKPPTTTDPDNTTTTEQETAATPPDPASVETSSTIAAPPLVDTSVSRPAPPIDEDALVARAADAAAGKVIANLGPQVRELMRMVDQLSREHVAQEDPAVAAKISLPDLPDYTEVPAGVIQDADIPYLAKNLTDTQLDQILASRASSSRLASALAKGAIPGRHVIAVRQLRMNLKDATGEFKGALVKADQVIAVADIEPDTLKALERDGHVVRPGSLAIAAA